MEDMRVIQGDVRQLQAARSHLIQLRGRADEKHEPGLPPGFLLGHEQAAREFEFGFPLRLGLIEGLNSHHVFDNRIPT